MTNQEIPCEDFGDASGLVGAGQILDAAIQDGTVDQEVQSAPPSGRLETQRAIIANEVFWRIGIGAPDYTVRDPW